jgi:hypothetical protein
MTDATNFTPLNMESPARFVFARVRGIEIEGELAGVLFIDEPMPKAGDKVPAELKAEIANIVRHLKKMIETMATPNDAVIIGWPTGNGGWALCPMQVDDFDAALGAWTEGRLTVGIKTDGKKCQCTTTPIDIDDEIARRMGLASPIIGEA